MSGKLNIVVSFLGNDKLSGAIRNIVGLGKSGGQALKGMAREAAGLERELRDVNREIAGKTRGNIIRLIDQKKALEAQLDRVNDKLRTQRRLLEINSNAEKMRARGEDLKSRGREHMVQGAALAAPLILAVKAGAEFSSGMVDIRQKADLSARETERLRDQILAAARAARQMPEDMRSAVDVLAGFGLDPRQAAQMVPAIGKLGTAFKVDLADGADAAFSNLNNLKVPIVQTGRAFDIMAAAGNAGAFEIRDMARHFPGLTSQLRAIGDEGLDAVGNLSAALQIARRGTGTADEAANNVKNLLQKMNSPATIRAFKKNFGIDLPAELKKLKDQGVDTFEAIAMVTDKATKGDLSKLGFAFEDMQAQGAIRSLVLDLKDYRQIRDESLKASGTIDAAFNVRMLSDATVSWTAMKAGVSELAITLGTTLLPVMVTTLGWVNRAAGAVGRWARENPKTASTIIQLVAGLAMFKIALGGAMWGLGALFGPLATAYRLFARMRALGTLGKVFAVLKVGALGLGRALLWVGRAMLMNPIGLLVTGVAVAGYMIWKHWDKIKSAFGTGMAYLSGAWSWMKGNARRMLEFSGPIGRAALAIWDNWATIKKAFGGALSYVLGLGAQFVSAGRAIIDGLVAGIQAAPGKIWAALKSIIGGAWRSALDFLGIKSPSRLFAAMGGHISAGLAMGIDRGGRQPIGAMRKLAGGVAAAGALSLSPAMAGAPIQPAGGAAAAAAAQGPAKIEIHIHAREGQDARAIADEVMRRLAAAQGVRQRSEFEDY